MKNKPLTDVIVVNSSNHLKTQKMWKSLYSFILFSLCFLLLFIFFRMLSQKRYFKMMKNDDDEDGDDDGDHDNGRLPFHPLIHSPFWS